MKIDFWYNNAVKYCVPGKMNKVTLHVSLGEL